MESGSPTTFCALPQSWFQKLTNTLAPADRLALAQTCSAMLQQVLTHCPVTLSLRRSNASSSVQLACQHCSDVHLDIDCDYVDSQQLLLGATAALDHALSSVQRMTLKSYGFRKPLLTWLQQTCPNLVTLTLKGPFTHTNHHHSTVTPPTNTNTPATATPLQPPSVLNPQHHTQLQHLCITAYFSMTVSDTVNLLHQQLHGLPNLQSFCYTGPEVSGDWLECFTTATHLTRLELVPTALLVWSDRPFPVPPQVARLFPHLHTLHVPDRELTDSSVSHLLFVLTLRSVRCRGIELEQDFSDRPCPWTELILQRIEVRTFAQLDLKHLTTLRATHTPNAEFDVFITETAHAVERFLSAVEGCGGIQWDADIDRLWVGMSKLVYDMRDDVHAADVMSVLIDCPATKLRISGEGLDPNALYGVGEHLPQAVEEVVFHDCFVLPGAGQVLLNTLHAGVKVVGFVFEELPEVGLEEQELVAMCVAAPRDVTVVVCDGDKWYDDTWMERVQEAMRAAGHQHVKLMVG